MNSLKNSHNKKTNLASLDYNLNSNNNQINYADNININNEDDGMIIGDFYKKYGDKLPIKKREVHRTPVPRQPVKIDKSLGCKLCEYCSNYVDNIYKHYSECQAKKMLENENRQYQNNLKSMTSNDEAMAKILQKKTRRKCKYFK
jgi:hypothetical protein